MRIGGVGRVATRRDVKPRLVRKCAGVLCVAWEAERARKKGKYPTFYGVWRPHKTRGVPKQVFWRDLGGVGGKKGQELR